MSGGWHACSGDTYMSANMLYCTTAPLDRYVMLPDRTLRTQMMTSHSICSKDFCNPWYTHPKKYYPPSAHLLPSRLLLSELTTVDKMCPWLSSMDLTTLAQPVALTTVERTWKMCWKRQTIGIEYVELLNKYHAAWYFCLFAVCEMIICLWTITGSFGKHLGPCAWPPHGPKTSPS